MAEIEIALEELKEESEVGQAVSPAVLPAANRRRGRWIAIAAAVLALAAALIFLLPRFRETPVPLKEVPLTSYPGYQGMPTLSPDGTQFAFVWDGGKENAPPQLYVSLAGRGTPLKLTNTPDAEVRYPAWSPDGQSIAFVRYAPGQPNRLIVIPALGGPERKIDERNGGHLAWSPDGKWLYFSSNVSPLHATIFVDPSAGGDRRQLTDPPAGSFGDTGPSSRPTAGSWFSSAFSRITTTTSSWPSCTMATPPACHGGSPAITGKSARPCGPPMARRSSTWPEN